LPRAYHNIRAAKLSLRSVRTHVGCADKICDNSSSFLENDVKYSVQGNHRHNYKAKQNICTSFILSDFTCNTCAGGEGGHTVLHREGSRIETCDLTPVAFVITDQNFPPATPVEDSGECLKIFRIEDASPQELVSAFLEATRGFIVPAGSVVALSSASHLAWVGAAAYAQDFVAARARLRAAFRNGIEVVHGVPVLLGGILDAAGYTATRDINTWLGHIHQARDITDTRALFKTLLSNTTPCTEKSSMPEALPGTAGSSVTPAVGTAMPEAAVSYHLSLPTCFEKKEVAIF
jgi:hypothetical protein